MPALHSQAAVSRQLAKELRPVPLWPEWPERPSLRFFLAATLVLTGLVVGAMGLAGAFPNGRTVAVMPLVVLVSDAPATARELVGRRAADIRQIFGPPLLIRREPPAEIWQYNSGTCVLDVYLYGEQQPDRVTHAEVRHTDPDTGADDAFATDCLFALQVSAEN